MYENTTPVCCASQEPVPAPATSYRERCKAILNNLVECHAILDEMIGTEGPRDTEKWPAPESRATEVSQNLADIQDCTHDLCVRLRSALDKF